ncbi:RHS repeat-associated core domain-containing protein [Pseudomonas sp. RIT-PI-q]|uniref:RHS repeat-associated core domain-containing protein n=1 Tax=Pseudomonas sp. RIT-PI-q TaxID=1690247 RepID=UPI000750E9CD|nr:RHS repeat-associated core domain-containing protein [Pseudomonas sp. RIT-PI-q]
MSITPRQTELCRYHYDPLDQQSGCTLAQQAILQRFYCRSRWVTEVQGAVQTSLFQHDNQPLAQRRQQSGKVERSLLAIDQKNSVLSVLDATGPRHQLAYAPYGYHRPENGQLSLLGFNGERRDPITGSYHLGNGYRQFNPVLMRFNSPDNMSPFDKGGVNAYAYCEGEPILRSDPDGRFFQSALIKPLQNALHLRQSSSFLAKQLRVVKVVRLDGEPIKKPFDGDDAVLPGADLYKHEYKKLNKVKMKVDRYTAQLERENLNRVMGSGFDISSAQSRSNLGQTDVSRGSKYLFNTANSAPMRNLLNSIKGMDNAIEANKTLSDQLKSIAEQARTVRG